MPSAVADVESRSSYEPRGCGDCSLKMIECPSCGRQQEPSLICAECGAPLAAPLDCFAALGLPRKLTIDLDALERRYHELSRKIHPDRFASSEPKVRDASVRATATLTRSYRTLRDPVARGLYWLELNGEKLAENNKRVPPEAGRAGVRSAGAAGRDAAGDGP